MMNGATALPNKIKTNVIINEWERIKTKCGQGMAQIKTERSRFKKKLLLNNHHKIPKLSLRPKPVVVKDIQDPIFYLNIPFIDDTTNTLLRRALHPLGLNIRFAHKSKYLKDYFIKHSSSLRKPSCNINNCYLNNELCFLKFVVYKATCSKCNQFYIGSTKRFLHLRVKEHLIMKSSNLFQHHSICHNVWNFNILSRSNNITDMRIKEALFIQHLRPDINKKENLFSIFNYALV
jgi:hypothetical protein